MQSSRKSYPPSLISQKEFLKFISLSISAIFLFTLYCTFRIEIATYWNQIYSDSVSKIYTYGERYSSHYKNYDFFKFKTIWIINYSLLFVSVLSFLNLKKLGGRLLRLIHPGLITLTIGVFLIRGLYVLSELRQSYLEQALYQYYQRDAFNIGIRYVSFAFMSLALVSCLNYIRRNSMKIDFKNAFDVLLHTSILWMASSELINWMDIAKSTQSYKLGLSILWGLYAFFLIALGIWKKKKHLRVGAIALFGATLVKLFFYDISHLGTIAKTVVLLSLGVLLLIVSFLYNKYKHSISDEAPQLE